MCATRPPGISLASIVFQEYCHTAWLRRVMLVPAGLGQAIVPTPSNIGWTMSSALLDENAKAACSHRLLSIVGTLFHYTLDVAVAVFVTYVAPCSRNTHARAPATPNTRPRGSCLTAEYSSHCRIKIQL